MMLIILTKFEHYNYNVIGDVVSFMTGYPVRERRLVSANMCYKYETTIHCWNGLKLMGCAVTGTPEVAFELLIVIARFEDGHKIYELFISHSWFRALYRPYKCKLVAWIPPSISITILAAAVWILVSDLKYHNCRNAISPVAFCRGDATIAVPCEVPPLWRSSTKPLTLDWI